VARGGQKKRAPANRATGAKCLHEGPTCVAMVMCTRRILTGSFPSTYSLKFGEFLWLAEQNPPARALGLRDAFRRWTVEGSTPTERRFCVFRDALADSAARMASSLACSNWRHTGASNPQQRNLRPPRHPLAAELFSCLGGPNAPSSWMRAWRSCWCIRWMSSKMARRLSAALPVMISTSDRHLGRSAEPDIGDHGRSSFRCE
jgi:hypothetical protein